MQLQPLMKLQHWPRHQLQLLHQLRRRPLRFQLHLRWLCCLSFWCVASRPSAAASNPVRPVRTNPWIWSLQAATLAYFAHSRLWLVHKLDYTISHWRYRVCSHIHHRIDTFSLNPVLDKDTFIELSAKSTELSPLSFDVVTLLMLDGEICGRDGIEKTSIRQGRVNKMAQYDRPFALWFFCGRNRIVKISLWWLTR